MIYLASPYTAKTSEGKVDEVIQHKRYIEACLAAGYIMLRGDLVYSPIAHWHIIDQLFKGSIQWEDYLASDCAMIELCEEVHVLQLDGWKESQGVKLEIAYAKLKNKPVRYFTISAQGVHYAPEIG